MAAESWKGRRIKILMPGLSEEEKQQITLSFYMLF